jgi:hypothetical protein
VDGIGNEPEQITPSAVHARSFEPPLLEQHVAPDPRRGFVLVDLESLANNPAALFASAFLGSI